MVTEKEKEVFETIEPLGKNILIKRDVFSAARLIISEGQGKYKPQGTVVSVSPNCEIIKKGDKVAWSSMTPLQVVFLKELEEIEETKGNYVATSEDYLVYKYK